MFASGLVRMDVVALIMIVALPLTGVVAIFIPIVLRIARNAAIPAGRLMMLLFEAA